MNFDRTDPAYYADILRTLERNHAMRGYTDTTRAPGDVFTLPTRMDIEPDVRDNAWYLDALHCALKCPNRIYAFRALLQAERLHKAAIGPWEHDALLAAQNRIEAFLERGRP
jgi:hypothetical protein